MALAVAMGPTAQWTLDHSRSARESLPFDRYLANPYYRTWYEALCSLLLERGLVTVDEVRTGCAESVGPGRLASLKVADVDRVLATGSPTLRPLAHPPRFEVGQLVQVKATWPDGHTRAPGYVHGRSGRVAAVLGAHILPDRRSRRLVGPFDETPEWLYTVVFQGRELWGDDAEPATEVSVDAFESYLLSNSSESSSN
jgi:nitrile hydratase